jgi:hypothetical protein
MLKSTAQFLLLIAMRYVMSRRQFLLEAWSIIKINS